MPFKVMRNNCNSWNFLVSKYKLTSTAQVTLTKFGTVEDNLHRAVISIGFGGLLGSTPGLLVGMGFGKVCNLPLTFTHTEDGKLSSCSHDVSSRLKKIVKKKS